MMRRNAMRLALALILILGVSAGTEEIRKVDLHEDVLFWERELQDASVSMPPPESPAPSSTASPAPETTAPTSTPPPVPTPPAVQCELEISIVCEVGEGIECINYEVPADRCIQEVVYSYTFENTGDVELEITEATSEHSGEDPTDLIEFFVSTTLEAGESYDLAERVELDFCQEDPIMAVVRATGNPGPCEAEESYEATADIGRALRGRK